MRRLALAAVTLVGVVVAVFIMTHLLPSDPAALRAGPLASEELIAQYRREMGLDQPLYVQFADYARDLLRGDLGNSWRTEQPVRDELGQRLPASLELAATALAFAMLIGLSLGILSAMYFGKWIDHAARVFATLGASLALFWLALVGVQVFYYNLRWAPPPLGRLTVGLPEPPAVTGLFTLDGLLAGDRAVFADAVGHLWLPALTLAFVVSAPLIKIVRAAMLQALSSDFVRTARAIGLSSRQVVLVDALRNAFIPVLTTVGIVFGYLMAGNVIIERVFSWPGIGYYAWNALITNDFNAVQGFVLLIAVVYVLLNLFIDLAYGIIDPRIRIG
ncbi:MAG: peptide ABC transporter permease [Chloroflexi bacterium RBG_16_63_12]|nr:MAG: peptide ABC transporter permease [Chloroflexi bacterium RBG_16_63_12]